MQEKIVETKTCKQCNTNFDITDKDLEFYNKISPKFNGEIFHIPIPTLCPECRLQKRFSFRNIRNLYKNKSDLSGKSILSTINPESSIKILGPDEWWSESFDAIKYGTDFDFTKTFSEQFEMLLSEAPRCSLSLDYLSNENSDYINGANNVKDCYLSYSVNNSENIIYSECVSYSINSVDCLNIDNLENCYECVDSNNLYKCFYSKNLIGSSNCYFCWNSEGCKNCIGCINLKNKSYCILNKEYTKEEYIIKKQDILNNIDDFKKEIYDFFKSQIKNENLNINVEKSSGEYLKDISNSNNCFDCSNGEKLNHCFQIKNGGENCYDISFWGQNVSNSYENISIGNNSHNNLFNNTVFSDASNILYSYFCGNGSSDLFGCFGLMGKKYCILNKQYTKEEYNALMPKIINHMKKTGEWGEFFSQELSDFGYNETTAQEYFPLTKKEALKKGFKWSDYEVVLPRVEKTISASKLPKNITDIPDDIINWAIKCEITKKPFRIIKQELEFYRKFNLPIPKKHPDIRHSDRMGLRNDRLIYDRKCDKCSIEIKTTYSPNGKEIVYCENCYNKEVY